MNEFEVLYIDKFADLSQSRAVLDKLTEQFHLDDRQRQKLSSGNPVIIKQHIDIATAEQFRRAIAAAGGTCWIQEQDAQGFHIERRKANRRSGIDRRSLRRTSAIMPDRRNGRDRRQDLIH